MRTQGKFHRLIISAVAVCLFATIGANPALAKIGPKPDSAGTCPSSNALGNFETANNVGASFKSEGLTTKYTFESFEDEEPAGGVPGLIKYCVYPDSSAPPTAINTVAKGGNGEAWISSRSKHSGDFTFGRPRGNPSNIPLEGQTTEMGTATWKVVPTEQTILLHINDPEVCAALYPAGEYETPPDTCFVLPGEPEQVVCDAGAGFEVFAYNVMPFGFNRGCPPPPSQAFEAQQTSEFGDEVGLAGTGTKITSMTVDLQSYGCSDEGQWNLGESNPCKSTEGETFTIPAKGPDPEGITAHIYKVVQGTPDTVGEEIGTATNADPIPYRPSADPVKCPGGETSEQENASKWYDPVAEMCVSSLSVPITFEFSGEEVEVPEGGEVIWTVTFNTTHYGYNPIGEETECFETFPGGCGYDSLNVGVKTYANAPYAGIDVNEDGVFIKRTPGTLEEETGWKGFTPLAQIATE